MSGDGMMRNISVANESLSNLKPVIAGYEDCSSGHFFGPAIRNHWLIHYVVSGVGYFEIEGRQYTVSSGSMFVIPPYIETFYAADKDKPWSYIWIGFEADGPLPCTLRDVIYAPRTAEIFESVKYGNPQALHLTAKLWELFSLLSDGEQGHTDYAEAALGIIQSQYINGITVTKIAELLNINRTYLSSVFKDKYGVSPKKYLLDYRMQIASSLLEKGTRVTVTANSVGYTDMFTFSKAFKSYYGLSPSEYAKSIAY